MRKNFHHHSTPQAKFNDNLSRCTKTTRPNTSVSRTLKTSESIKSDMEFNKLLK